jgi:hypothetical protein
MKALIIHRDLNPALLLLDDERLGRLMRAAISLVQDERDEPPPGCDTDTGLAFAWAVLREKTIDNGVRYDQACQRRIDKAHEAAAARYRQQAIPGELPTHAQAMPKHAQAMHKHANQN